MEEPLRRPFRFVADHEHGVVDAEERVERHREAALGRTAAPRAHDLLELLAKVRLDLFGPPHLAAIAGARQPVDRLAHLPDRPALE